VFVKLGGGSLPGTNALAYYKNSFITGVKSFMSLTPDDVFAQLRDFIQDQLERAQDVLEVAEVAEPGGEADAEVEGPVEEEVLVVGKCLVGKVHKGTGQNVTKLFMAVS
jgi:hypothetical protein